MSDSQDQLDSPSAPIDGHDSDAGTVSDESPTPSASDELLGGSRHTEQHAKNDVESHPAQLRYSSPVPHRCSVDGGIPSADVAIEIGSSAPNSGNLDHLHGEDSATSAVDALSGLAAVEADKGPPTSVPAELTATTPPSVVSSVDAAECDPSDVQILNDEQCQPLKPPPASWPKRQLLALRQNLYGDALFLLQLICCLVFGVGQFLAIIAPGATGISITWYLLWFLFCLINFALNLKAHGITPSRSSTQTLVIYACWMALVLLDLGGIFAMRLAHWDERDTITAGASGALIFLTLFIARICYRISITASFSHPLVRGWLAVGFKAIPQCVLAYQAVLLGASSYNMVSVASGHVTIIARILTLSISIHKSGWELNRTASLMSEVFNELSWIAATAAIAVVKGRG